MDFIYEKPRDQIFFTSLNQMVSRDSWSRVVDMFVSMLPLEELGFNTTHAPEGRRPFHPSTLLKLYFYGYRHGIRSSRKLAHACKVNVEVMWLIGGLKPSARKIAYFRKDNAVGFKNAMRYFVGMLKDLKLIEGKTIAIDSFKIRAQNSLKNNYNKKKIDRHITYIDDKISEFEQELDENDATLTRSKKKELASKIKLQKQRKKSYKALEKQLEEKGEKQISTTDPDSKSVVFQRTSVKVGYNIQASVDEKHKLFVHNDTGSVNDTHALACMAIETKDILDQQQMDVIADKGYTTGIEISKCQEEGITTYCSPKAHSSQKNGLYDMQVFKYDEKADTYTCPAGETLITNGTIYNKNNHKVRHYKNLKACKGCSIRAKCTKNKNGRFIERSIYQKDLEQNADRVNQNPEYYKQRQQIIEHQFGTLKRQWGFTYTLMKGKVNVLTEVHILMICYNLKRLMSIYTPKQLKSLLKGLCLHIFGFISRQIRHFKIKSKINTRPIVGF